MFKFRHLLLAGVLLASMKSSAHRIEYFTSNGCLTVGSPLVVDAYVVYAPSNTRYQWQFKGSDGQWNYFSATTTINGQNYAVSNFQGIAEDNAPNLTFASPNANLDNVQLRCLMRENYYPSQTNISSSSTVWGGSGSSESKYLRIRYNSAGACSVSCEDNTLTNSNGFYGGFEQVTYNPSNDSYTDNNWNTGEGSTDYPVNGGQLWVKNNPYAVSSSFGEFAPHSGNYQLIVSGSNNVNDDVWHKTVSATAGQQYSFSVWVARVKGTYPTIKLVATSGSTTTSLANVSISSTYAVGQWVQVTGVYNATTSGNVTFGIRNSVANNGTDYWAMDDICLTVEPPITIGDYVWFDVDRDGLQESNEPGVSGVTVQLFPDADGNGTADGAATATATTNTNGLYSFTGFPRGKYFVKFTLPTGYTGFTTQDAGAANISSAVNASGQTGTHDFQGNYDMKDAGLLKNLTITGNVYNDGNALTDNIVNGTALTAASGAQLHANLFDGTTFVATTPVAAGAYSFANLKGNRTFNVVISTVAGATGTTSTLPTNWIKTGENIGTAAGNDGTPDGKIAVVMTTSSVASVNFGFQQPPTANTATLTSQLNPGGTSFVVVPPTNFGGADTDGSISGIKITAFPTNTTTLRVNNVPYTAANFATTLQTMTIPTNASGQPTQEIAVDPVDGSVSVAIPYKTIDNGGATSSNTGAVNVPFFVQPDLTPLIVANPTTMNGITNFNVTIKVSEVANTATSGLITVLVPKDSRISFTYVPTLTTIGGTALNNANWTLNNTNQFYYIFTSTTAIAAGSFSTIGFAAQFNPLNAQGVYVLSSIITSGSGGELKTSNNSSSVSLNYFAN